MSINIESSEETRFWKLSRGDEKGILGSESIMNVMSRSLFRELSGRI